jgi:hypothetical protein
VEDERLLGRALTLWLSCGRRRHEQSAKTKDGSSTAEGRHAHRRTAPFHHDWFPILDVQPSLDNLQPEAQRRHGQPAIANETKAVDVGLHSHAVEVESEAAWPGNRAARITVAGATLIGLIQAALRDMIGR